MEINEKDFEIQWFSGTGKGGQHRNKHQNCCRVIHTPTGIRAIGTSSRNRETNKQNAISVCVSRIHEHYSTDTERYRASPERIRTYHEPNNIVIDHKSGKTSDYKSVVHGNNFEAMIESRKKAMLQE